MMPVSYQADAIFGSQANTSAIPADLLNVNANGETDWNSVIANGIRGAAQGAISALVGEKFQSGQLRDPATVQVTASNKMIQWLLIGGVAYLVLKK